MESDDAVIACDGDGMLRDVAHVILTRASINLSSGSVDASDYINVVKELMSLTYSYRDHEDLKEEHDKEDDNYLPQEAEFAAEWATGRRMNSDSKSWNRQPIATTCMRPRCICWASITPA